MRFAPQPPIYSLPVELLSYIFVLGTHSLPDALEDGREPQELPPFNADSVKTPLTYSAVCRHWRSVALGTAALWTSICITVGSVQTDIADQSKSLNLSHITSYLSLSRKCSLNILLDARDADWEFCEHEIAATSDFCDYIPPFSVNDMRAYLTLLLPHLSRWRSIDILTDTWAPMYTALGMLNEPLMTRGAPLLESFTLMRCNDYISHSPQFQPSSMKSPELFSSAGFLEPPECHRLLPRLRHLTLRGVHVEWSNLSRLLQPSLTSLELSSHSLDVRPTYSVFRDVLCACPELRSLVVNGSGFVSEDKNLSLKTGAHIINKSIVPVSLPLLEELTIGFRSAPEGCDMLTFIHAPNIRQLSLEDATHPGEVDDIEADEVLLLAAGYDLNHPSSCSRASFAQESSSPFPALQKLILTGVRAETDALRRVFTSLPHLQSLKFNAMPRPMDAIHAMLPPPAMPVYRRLVDPRSTSSGFILCPSLSSSPCPKVQELSLRSGGLSKDDLSFITTDFLIGRLDTGAESLKRLDVQLADRRRAVYDEFVQDPSFFRRSDIKDEDGVSLGVRMDLDVGSLLPSASSEVERTSVRVFRAPIFMGDADDLTSEAHIDEALLYGGIFNDPIFDAQYGSN
ncbi:hypothetical protein BT96DRAFT_923995 [Gymnopus androsaceus JB14]|uniref:Uncharacterized protein n=1 Tax=Gymnopus androsaceus JB14 TaxID=1447944 RepID=A0A6A4H5N0_9AGAR|nr:hypothetical protein BT96DRAFT_923995 [Gymnopus androsaceus JB14]